MNSELRTQAVIYLIHLENTNKSYNKSNSFTYVSSGDSNYDKTFVIGVETTIKKLK